MDLSLITSLFRSEAHFAAYGQHAADAADHLRRAGLALELVLVANSPSPDERRAIENLASAVRQAGAAVIIQYVARETVYASWNRGVRASSGECLGFWSVDDVRYGEALVEGIRLLRGDCDLVDFPFVQIVRRAWFGALTTYRHTTYPAPYDPSRVTPRAGVGPFFLFRRDLYDQAGPFDEHFRVAGDFDWAARDAVRAARTCTGTELAGEFILHGGNLSGSRNPYEWVEHNTVLLRHAQWDDVRPVDPDLMRTSWQSWGDQGTPVPDDVAARLWGAEADAFCQQWQRDRRRAQIANAVRTLPRAVIDRTGLRSLLARLGVVTPPD